jgi:protein MpaA
MIAAITAIFLTGCDSSNRSSSVEMIKTPQLFTVQTLGLSNEKRPIDLYLAGSGPETILILASIHGNEQAGTPLVYKLLETLRQRGDLLAGRRLLIIPAANPDGMARNTRENTYGIDLNRNFPAANRENNAVNGFLALCEPESKILYNLLGQYRPDRIVSIHQPLNCIDYDGPAEALAYQMAAYCPLPVNKLGARPGSFGSYAGETLAIPIVTMELERSDDNLSPDELWKKYGMALMAAVMYPQAPY